VHIVRLVVLALAGAGSLSACASIVEGSSQNVAINTTPTGCQCKVEREGELLATVPLTPASVHIDKSKNDIMVTCSKDGYETAMLMYSPEFVGTTFGNILLGGGIGAIVDAGTGANYIYPSQITLSLTPKVAMPPVGS
jgi:hypothetical protein